MASPETKPNVCLMCLDAPAVGKLGICNHSYCESCLLAHIKNKGENEMIACPACQGCQPGNPYGGANINIVGDGEETMPSKSQKTTAREKKTTPLVNSNCKLCHYKGKTVKAVNICKECKSVPLCMNCSQAHRKNKVTQNHVVTVLRQTRDEVLCKAHGEPLELFCTTCSLSVCHICISLDHVDHAVETFNDVVNTEVVKVRRALENEEKRSEMLKSDEKELQESKVTAQEMEDVLIKSIEDHAEKWIEEILKNKEVLKKQVRDDFEVVRKTMEKQLEAMPELQRVSRAVAAAANQLLNEQAELHSTYVETLGGLKEQLDKLKEDYPVYEEDKRKYQIAFKVVCKKAMKFYPRTPNCKIGGFKDLCRPRCDAGGPCVCDTCEKILKFPNRGRVVECRQKGTCTCGTCGCVFSRKNLYSDGMCIGCNRKITVYFNDHQFP